MQLDKLEAVLRQRTSFEAIDLGFAMFRRWWRPLYGAWFLCVTPCFVLVWALLHSYPFWAFLLLWWLKPLWDRVPLFVISRSLFGDTPSVGAKVRTVPKLWLKHLFLSLLLHRFDLARSFFLPVLQLEGGKRQARSRRRSVLLRNMSASAAWLTVVCLCLDFTVFVGLLGLLLTMLPEAPEYAVALLWDQFWAGTAPWWLRASLPVAAFLSLSFIEPLFVTAGFALYLNRRTQLEGWDIELIFRRLAQRLRNASTEGASRAALVLVAAGLGLALWAASALVAPGTAHAQPATAPDAAVAPREVPDGGTGAAPNAATPAPAGAPAKTAAPDPRQTIDDILARSELEHRAVRKRWRRRHEPEPEPEERGEPWQMPEFLQWLGRLLGGGIEGLLWVLAGVVLAALLLFVFARLRALGPSDRSKRAKRLRLPKVGKLEDEAPAEPLPPDVPGTAWALWEQGQQAEALGLLYRGALAALAQHRSITVAENATEGECLRAVRHAAPGSIATFFERVTRAWQEVAYAQRSPDDQHVRSLCAGWPEHFGAGS